MNIKSIFKKIAISTSVIGVGALIVAGPLYFIGQYTSKGTPSNKNTFQMQEEYNETINFFNENQIKFVVNKGDKMIVINNPDRTKEFFDPVKEIVFDWSTDGKTFKRVVVENGKTARIMDAYPADDKAFYFHAKIVYNTNRPTTEKTMIILPKKATNPRRSRFQAISKNSEIYKNSIHAKNVTFDHNFNDKTKPTYVAQLTPFEKMKLLNYSVSFYFDIDKYSRKIFGVATAGTKYKADQENTNEYLERRRKIAKKTIQVFDGYSFTKDAKTNKTTRNFKLTRLKVDDVEVELNKTQYIDKSDKVFTPKDIFDANIKDMKVFAKGEPATGDLKKWSNFTSQKTIQIEKAPGTPRSIQITKQWVDKNIYNNPGGYKGNVLETLNGIRKAFIAIGRTVTSDNNAELAHLKDMAYGKSITSSAYIEGTRIDANGKAVGKPIKMSLVYSSNRMSNKLGMNYNNLLQFRKEQRIVGGLFTIDPLKWLKQIGYNEVQPINSSYTICWMNDIAHPKDKAEGDTYKNIFSMLQKELG